MLILPAIDLYEGKAVRLYKGDYEKMTVYSAHPKEVAANFHAAGASWIHMVDLEGARNGGTPNLDIIKQIVEKSKLKVEVGGGVRSMDIVEDYLQAGVSRVILGTAAVRDREFLKETAAKHGEKIAVGVDIKDGFVAIKGWTEKSEHDAFEFCEEMQQLGIRTIISTDISKDGAMRGTNLELYRELKERFSMNIIASGGISSLDDLRRLREMNIYGAIIGRAYYTGTINLREAIRLVE